MSAYRPPYGQFLMVEVCEKMVLFAHVFGPDRLMYVQSLKYKELAVFGISTCSINVSSDKSLCDPTVRSQVTKAKNLNRYVLIY